MFNTKQKEQIYLQDYTRRFKTAREILEYDDAGTLIFVQMEGKCYCCGKPGHYSNKCCKKDSLPREEWAINKAQQHVETSEKNATVKEQDNTKEEPGIGWAGVHCSFAQGFDLKNLILLDSDSTDTIFCNEKFVTNIRDADQDLIMSTNGGPISSSKKCDVPYFPNVWFNKNSITNIISLKDMTSKFRVTLDSDKEKALLVHMPDKIVKFKQMRNGLYALNPLEETNYTLKDDKYQLVNTIQENMNFLTPRQQKKARMARDLYHAMGTPSINDLRAMIRMNLIRNNQVTTQDLELAERAYGKDIATLKGKTTRSKPMPVMNDLIDIPNELLEVHKDVTLSMDGMTVNGLKFLTTISHNIYYRTAQYIANPVASVYTKKMNEILAIYAQGGFTVRKIHSDNEFHKAMDEYSSDPSHIIKMNYSAAQEHVPRAERNNRTIQERVRATFHRLPYQSLPRIMIKYLVLESARKLNYFPNKYGVSKYFSPRMILHQENIDYDKHCRFVFGEYVQAHHEPRPLNNQEARSLDCLYLRPTTSAQGTHELYHIATNKVITRRKLNKVPLTPNIIKLVENQATLDGVPQGLKIQNRAGVVLFDSAWIAGVDYDGELFDDEDYSQDSNNDNQSNVSNQEEMDYNEIDDMDENELADIFGDAGIVPTMSEINNKTKDR